MKAYRALCLFMAFFSLALLVPIGEIQATTFTVDSTGDGNDANFPGGPFDGVCDDGSGNCTLRAAIDEVNAGSGGDLIDFNIPGTDGGCADVVFPSGTQKVCTITPNPSLPNISKSVMIDGFSQPNSSPNTNGPGLPDNSVHLIVIAGTAAPVDSHGFFIRGGNTTLRGLVVSGFKFSLTDGTQVTFGNVANNINNVLEGCFIGTDATGTVAGANQGTGIVVVGLSTGNHIGGPDPSQRNIISGNGRGGIGLSSDGNFVQGAFVGTDASGTTALGNDFYGISIFSQGGNTIGGTTPAERNVISGNSQNGVQIDGAGSTGNIVQGNFIGTEITGTLALPNTNAGILIQDAGGNTIGGTSSGARNLISGNQVVGIFITGSATNNLVQGNYIGTDAAGTAAIPNNGGLCIQNGATLNTVGGSTPGSGNVISGNDQPGICIGNSGTSQNTVQGNLIGTDASGTNPLPNNEFGIRIFDTAFDNTIGGKAAGEGNTIAFNNGGGVLVESGIGNPIWGNSIFSNTTNVGLGLMGLGIDLFPLGVALNDAGDGDAGPNNLQNFPLLTSAVFANGSTVIQGNLDSTGANFHLEFFSNDSCDPSGNGEGQTFLGAADVPSGNFNVVLPVLLSNQLSITATATSATNDTSEFSPCLTATALVEDCTNGIEDDMDSLVDCNDPDCASDPACVSTAELCNNGLDDDGDGLVDCTDPDCAGFPNCLAAGGSGGCSLGGKSFVPTSAGLLPFLSLAFLGWRRKKGLS